MEVDFSFFYYKHKCNATFQNISYTKQKMKGCNIKCLC